jgi:hypothetical protein
MAKWPPAEPFRLPKPAAHQWSARGDERFCDAQHLDSESAQSVENRERHGQPNENNGEQHLRRHHLPHKIELYRQNDRNHPSQPLIRSVFVHGFPSFHCWTPPQEMGAVNYGEQKA